MENNLDAVTTGVEQLHTAYLVQDGVVVVISHVVGCDRWELVAFQGEDTALQQDLVFFRKEIIRCRKCTVVTTLK